MFTDILWRFLILEMFVLGVLCLKSCSYTHPQEVYCTSDLVLKMSVDQIINETRGNLYKMKYIRSFRKEAANGWSKVPGQFVFLQTAHTLQKGGTYVIFGRAGVNGVIYSKECNPNKAWDKKDKFYKRALKRLYRRGCDCIDRIGSYERCRSLFSYMKKINKKCKWVKTREYKTCKRA